MTGSQKCLEMLEDGWKAAIERVADSLTYMRYIDSCTLVIISRVRTSACNCCVRRQREKSGPVAPLK